MVTPKIVDFNIARIAHKNDITYRQAEECIKGEKNGEVFWKFVMGVYTNMVREEIYDKPK